MKESIAQAFILNLILFFFGILVLLFFGSINYSKAYKVKNRIITIIEKYGGYDTTNTALKTEIDENLKKAGYSTSANGLDCKNRVLDRESGSQGTLVYPTDDIINTRQYHYCIIEHSGRSGGKYYQVVTYMEFNIPILRGFLEFPVRGETRVLFENVSV